MRRRRTSTKYNHCSKRRNYACKFQNKDKDMQVWNAANLNFDNFEDNKEEHLNIAEMGIWCPPK